MVHFQLTQRVNILRCQVPLGAFIRNCHVRARNLRWRKAKTPRAKYSSESATVTPRRKAISRSPAP